ncbi:hypothetical protein D3C84_698140 [compost metagenome]
MDHPPARTGHGQGVDVAQAQVQVHAHARQDGQAHLRLVLQGAAVMAALDTHQHAVLQRRGAHRVQPGLAEQQGFGKGLAGLDDFHQVFLAFAGEPVQLDLAADQQEKALGRIPLVHERAVTTQALEHGQGADFLEDFLRQLAEQVVPAQR